MRLIFSEHAWEDYLYWQQSDRKMLLRINALIKDIKGDVVDLLTNRGFWRVLASKV